MHERERHRILRAVCPFACALLIATAAGCGDDPMPDSNFYCIYEGRSTSCTSSSFGPWLEECSYVDFEIRDDLTPDSFCDQAYPPYDSECAASCCVEYEFQNVRASTSCY